MALPIRRTSGQVATGRWDPFQEMEELYQRMERVMEDFFNSVRGTDGFLLWSPPADLEETEDAYIVEIDLPGAKRDDVHIELQDNELHVFGELKEKERVGVLRTRMRRTGRFDHWFTLPGEVDADKVEAELRDGVLTVRLPKATRSQTRKIEVKGS